MPPINAPYIGLPWVPPNHPPYMIYNVSVQALRCAFSEDGQPHQLCGLVGGFGCVLGDMVMNDDIVALMIAGVKERVAL